MATNRVYTGHTDEKGQLLKVHYTSGETSEVYFNSFYRSASRLDLAWGNHTMETLRCAKKLATNIYSSDQDANELMLDFAEYFVAYLPPTWKLTEAEIRYAIDVIRNIQVEKKQVARLAYESAMRVGDIKL